MSVCLNECMYDELSVRVRVAMKTVNSGTAGSYILML
jgi:hypothetical protein